MIRRYEVERIAGQNTCGTTCLMRREDGASIRNGTSVGVLRERVSIDRPQLTVDYSRPASQKAPCPPKSPVQFTSLPSNATDASIQCLPPYPLLTSLTWSCPCSSPLKICVKPLASENILRIQWKDARAGVGGLMSKEEEVESIVVLWSGNKREVWNSVRVSRWAGRGGLIGRWVIGWIELVFK